MRKKTMRNEQFYLQYIYRPELEDPENVSLNLRFENSFDFYFLKTFFFTTETNEIQSSHEFRQ